MSIASLVGKGMAGYVCQDITPYFSNTHFNTTSHIHMRACARACVCLGF